MVDADALFAAAASPSEHGASLLVLRLAELSLIYAVTSEQVITEVARNLTEKLPAALPTFQLLTTRSLYKVSDPAPDALPPYQGAADEKDLPILVAAVNAGCQWLVTFNVRHFQPGVDSLQVVRPGDFILRIRTLLHALTL